MINHISFPETTSAQINVALLADKMNEIIDFMNEHTIEEDERELREGVKITTNGKYMLNGKFIREEDAWL